MIVTRGKLSVAAPHTKTCDSQAWRISTLKSTRVSGTNKSFMIGLSLRRSTTQLSVLRYVLRSSLTWVGALNRHHALTLITFFSQLTEDKTGWIDDFAVKGPAPDSALLSWDKSPVANGAHYFLFGRVDKNDPPGVLRESGFGVEFPNYIVDVKKDDATGRSDRPQCNWCFAQSKVVFLLFLKANIPRPYNFNAWNGEESESLKGSTSCHAAPP